MFKDLFLKENNSGDKTTDTPAAFLDESKLKVGEKVFLGDDLVTIKKISGAKATVEFSDGDETTVKVSKLGGSPSDRRFQDKYNDEYEFNLNRK